MTPRARRAVLGSVCRGPVLALLLLPAVCLADLRLGVLAPLNGLDAPFGVGMTNGVDLGLTVHNSSSDERFRIRVEDTSEGDGATIRKSLRLLDELGSQVLLGEVWSARTLAVGGIALARNAVLISPVATHADIAGLGEGVYSLAVPRGRQIDELLRFARDSMSVTKPAIFYPNSDEGSELMRLAAERWTGFAMPRPVRVAYPAGEHDFVAEVEQALEAEVDAFLALGTSRETLSLVSHASQMGFLGPYLGLETLGTQENVNLLRQRSCTAAFADDSYLVSLPGASGPESFEQAYRQRYGTTADGFARHGFLAMMTLSLAFESAGGDIGDLRDALEDLRDPMLNDRLRYLRPPRSLARVRVVLFTGGLERDVW